ncbi:MAG: DUF4920 domain-containing protein [Cellulophaga sp.]|nr:DUF4920 domain-containing protein [Cellulophaga sp.]MDP5231804.1 DUF4920 domain-containing protein [Cellulophaga sp.]
MKRINILCLFFVLIMACKEQNKEQVVEEKEEIAMNYASFGAEIDANNALTNSEMTKKFQNLAVADTLNTKFSATVLEVCKSKGCWMKLKLDDGSEAMVKFKDYGFFMPKDIDGKEVIVNGKAFVEEMSVDEQRHYAEDGGESAEAIEAITEPKKTLSFEADGVLLKE